MMPRTWTVSCIAALALVATASSSAAQEKTRARAGADPYTGGEAAAIAKAGYESLGPFSLGQNHTTAMAEELLGTEPLIWIETAHFRIGVSLPEVSLTVREDWGKDWRRQVMDELDELRERLPGIKKRIRKLDPWLRAHLTAMRLEKLYGEVLAVLQREDAWFADASVPASDAEGYRGEGPYFGMREKFLVLVVEKAASHARYTAGFHGYETRQPVRHNDRGFGCMVWAASLETANGLYYKDPALHAAMAFNVSHNLYSAYRTFGHELPPWLVTGLGHWHARKVSRRFPTYDRRSEDEVDRRSHFWDWEARVQGMAKHAVFEPLERFCKRQNAGDFRLEQHIQSWALAGFLVEQHPDRFADLVHRLKAPFHSRLRMPTAEELERRQVEAVTAAFGRDLEALDAEWREHILGTAARRRKR